MSESSYRGSQEGMGTRAVTAATIGTALELTCSPRLVR